MPYFPPGGSTSPGGVNTNVQYNASGVFGGASNVLSDGTSLTTVSLAASNSNATFNLQGSAFTSTGININGSGNVLVGGDGAGLTVIVNDGIFVRNGTGTGISWMGTNGTEVSMSRWQQVGANNTSGIIEQKFATVPQTMRWYNTFTSTTVFERGGFDWVTTPNTFRVRSESGGGGGTTRIIAIDGFIKAGAATATDIPTSTWALIHDSVGTTTKLVYNDAGTLRTVALA